MAAFGGRGGLENCRIRAGVRAGRAPAAESRPLSHSRGFFTRSTVIAGVSESGIPPLLVRQAE